MRPSVEQWTREGKDYITFLAQVARISRRGKFKSRSDDVRLLRSCLKRQHWGVFEHWPMQGAYTYPRLNRYLQAIDAHQEPRIIGGKDFGRVARLGIDIIDSYDIPPTFHFYCTRACANQLRTYRDQCSWIMESWRYVDFAKPGVVWEYSLKEEHEGDLLAHKEAQAGYQAYLARRQRGWKPEDARGVLPIETCTHFVGTAPRWKWEYICKQRVDHSTGRAQKEVAKLMERVRELLKEERW